MMDVRAYSLCRRLARACSRAVAATPTPLLLVQLLALLFIAPGMAEAGNHLGALLLTLAAMMIPPACWVTRRSWNIWRSASRRPRSHMTTRARCTRTRGTAYPARRAVNRSSRSAAGRGYARYE